MPLDPALKGGAYGALAGQFLLQCIIKLDVTGKSAGCPAFLPVGRGGEESRPYNHILHFPEAPPCGRGASLLILDLMDKVNSELPACRQAHSAF